MKSDKYNVGDISVVIATYNRAKDLTIALKSFSKEVNRLKEVLIIDQSKNDETKRLIKNLNNNKIKYIYSKTPSLTLARNKGVKKSSIKSKIILFIDDDITLGENYFDKLIEVFNLYPCAIGVSGHYFPKDKKINKLEIAVRKLFCLENWGINEAKVHSVYGASYPYKINKIINSEWLSGFNMAFKKEIFDKDLFDENFSRYGLAEDFEFSSRINKKYPQGLFITPYARIIHHVSTAERMPTEKLAYMNHVNHTYIQSKLFDDFRGNISWMIALSGMSLLNIFNLFIHPTRVNVLKCKFYFKALNYCIRRWLAIRKGNLDLPVNT